MSANRRFLRSDRDRRIERERVNDPDDATDKDVGFTVEEKTEFYAARELLLYYPLQGKHGGLFQDIATAVGVSRNYVLYTIWPKEPKSLFSGRSINYKAIWRELKDRLEKNEVVNQYRQIIGTALRQGKVTFKAYTQDAKFVKRRLEILGYEVEQSVEKTTPRTYTFTVSKVPDKAAA